ncbi:MULTISPECIES: CYTH domain-containing protein [Ectothiorhodospira]|jgi:adenylate cyclase|uniref:Adenylate cyclase n=1 Tax=Ectothiorhodospira marina TaxID=1396821 RepID=A0A1H7LTJ6_9GAMM|nr:MULTISPECIES: CYTH domain-containing protein [Ectothiorhodospira]MCG5516107.1 CYTH domain-containing protein [Ectothiorhodospira sp. 9100]MCG5519083.1 CYTH domain-containing protein [Ectothiorhodospira sp. 9905]SEL02301.1 adenylate cyclase [Ectothiorhodospira marina]
MGQEIEKKFLVVSDAWKKHVTKSVKLRQGYLCGNKSASVRVRVSDEQADLNIKSATLGVQRQEFEYPIPATDAHELLESLCHHPLIEKTRHFVPVGDHLWEVDVFEGDNAGLVVAEVELEHAQQEPEIPAWAGEEVSHDPRYYNTSLVQHPYKDW